MDGAAGRATPGPAARWQAAAVGASPDDLPGGAPGADYFAISRWTDEYTFGGQTTELTFWHRPLHAMTDAFGKAGFRLAVISEPAMSVDTPRELVPDQLADRSSFLCFIFFVLEAA